MECRKSRESENMKIAKKETLEIGYESVF